MLILFVAAVPGVFTSRVAADYNEDSRIDDLIARGKYVTASHAIEQAIGRARSVDDKESIPRLLAYLARFSIECGDLQKAEQAIRAAMAAGRYSMWSSWEAMAAREVAALWFARGEYHSAREAALTASRLAKDNNFYKIRIAYTDSLAALSSVSTGDRSSAAQLMEQRSKRYLENLRRMTYTRRAFFSPRANSTRDLEISSVLKPIASMG